MSMKTIKGVVMRVYEKKVNTTRGESVVFNLLVNVGGEEEWHNFGFKKPAVEENDYIKFVVKQKGNYWNAEPDSLEILKDEEAKPAEVMNKAVANVDNRQRSIVYQSAYERAINLISSAITHGFVTLPKAKSDRYDMYMSMVHEKALELSEMFISPPSDFAAPVVDAVDVTQMKPGPDDDDDDDGYTVV